MRVGYKLHTNHSLDVKYPLLCRVPVNELPDKNNGKANCTGGCSILEYQKSIKNNEVSVRACTVLQ